MLVCENCRGWEYTPMSDCIGLVCPECQLRPIERAVWPLLLANADLPWTDSLWPTLVGEVYEP